MMKCEACVRNLFEDTVEKHCKQRTGQPTFGQIWKLRTSSIQSRSADYYTAMFMLLATIPYNL